MSLYDKVFKYFLVPIFPISVLLVMTVVKPGFALFQANPEEITIRDIGLLVAAQTLQEDGEPLTDARLVELANTFLAGTINDFSPEATLDPNSLTISNFDFVPNGQITIQDLAFMIAAQTLLEDGIDPATPQFIEQLVDNANTFLGGGLNDIPPSTTFVSPLPLESQVVGDAASATSTVSVSGLSRSPQVGEIFDDRQGLRTSILEVSAPRNATAIYDLTLRDPLPRTLLNGALVSIFPVGLSPTPTPTPTPAPIVVSPEAPNQPIAANYRILVSIPAATTPTLSGTISAGGATFIRAGVQAVSGKTAFVPDQFSTFEPINAFSVLNVENLAGGGSGVLYTNVCFEVENLTTLSIVAAASACP